MFTRLGSLPCLSCCFSKEKVESEDPETPTTRVIKIGKINREIGLGASLFMMTTKSMIWFFLWMSIVNLPAMYFYYTASDASSAGAEGSDSGSSEGASSS